MAALKSKSKFSLQGSDFTVLEGIKSQANVLIFGDAGNGKTTFALRYAPAPVAFINFDNRGKHAVLNAQEDGRDIAYLHVGYPANYLRMDSEEVKKVGQKAVRKVVDNFEWAVRQSEKGNIRTICLDTATEYDEILKLALSGRIDKEKGDFGKRKDLINREFWRLCNLAREGNAHFIMLSRAKPIWENNEPTGRFTFRCPEVANDAVDWTGHIRLRKGRKGVTKKEFEMEVTKAGINIEELGEVYREEDWDEEGPFVHACMLQYGTGPEEWQ